ncbi:MAG: glycine betaine/L-proline ABC transporter substrate-binding protein ProX [Cyanothece sp. SIO2G6]|nr:glycine betaine/L-proline ABC transporter substrate-binding protein ProX [Cyanothece sp. SIO2G6]
MKFRGFSILAMLTALLVSMIACQPTPDVDTDVPAGGEIALPGRGIIVRPGSTNWLEERYQSEVVNIGLEELGYEVAEMQEAAYPVLYSAIANGDLDFTANSAHKTHTALLDNAGGDEVFDTVGSLYPLIQGYQIDKRTADEYQITTFERLQDPEIAQLFDSDGDGLANFMGCEPGWYCEQLISHQMVAYGLEETVEVNTGQYNALLPELIARYQEGGSILFYAFYPHWIAQVLKPDEDVVWLEVPFTSYPDNYEEPVSEADTTFEGQNLGIIQDSYAVAASDVFLEANPVAKRWFEQVQIPIEDVNAESLRIRDGENTAEDVRRHAEEWIEVNREQVDAWLEDARQAAN